MKKFIDEINNLAWTLAGTGLVLITLSGQVRTYGLWISGLALGINFAAMIFGNDD